MFNIYLPTKSVIVYEGQRRWKDYVTNDMIEKGVDDAMTAMRGEWKKMTCCAETK